ncbi:MAG: hypothetical protein AVO33_08345 [delta proteobacterium ML8_F1]|nr:MAG: hypothetical protein AVO33_08345 [delta proteobacterium ML8_F1]
MNRRERIQAALQKKETDRLPFSLWRHFPNLDQHPRKLAELSLEYQRKFNLDFIKFTPYGMTATIDWGVKLKFFPGFDTAAIAAEPAIKTPEDWLHLTPWSGTDGEYLHALEGLRLTMLEKPEDTPLIQTAFSPLTNAMKMAGEDQLLQHMREHPEKLETALQVMTETTIGYIAESIRRGAEGVFYSTQMSCYDKLTVEEQERFVRRYDEQILQAANKLAWFNVLHLHGSNTMFKEVADYPVQAINWHDRDDGPTIEEALKMTDKTLIGGLSHLHVMVDSGNEETIKGHVLDAWNQNDHRGIILGPGCVVNPNTPESYLELIRDTVMSTKK